MRRYIGYLIIAGTLSLTATARAETIILEASRDTTLYFSTTGALANGGGDFLFVGRANNGLLRRALMAFDVAGSIPAGARIESVELALKMTRTIVGPTTVNLHRLLADWGEGTSNALGNEGGGAAAQTGDATWLHTFSPAGLWQTPGGDFALNSEAAAVVGSEGTYTWVTSAEMVRTVQNWLDAPASNFGWILIGDEADTSAKRFNSRENPVGASGPLLTIDYTPTATPIIAIGRAAGIQAVTVAPSETIQLYVNTTNATGINPAQITGEWLALFATIDGKDSGVLLLTDQGLVPIAALSDISAATFSFDHTTDESFLIATLALGDIGLVSGDALIYLYAFTTSDFSALAVENIVTVNVR